MSRITEECNSIVSNQSYTDWDTEQLEGSDPKYEGESISIIDSKE